MPTFQYRAIQADGKIADGQLEAAGRPDALRQMEGRGLRPTHGIVPEGWAAGNWHTA